MVSTNSKHKTFYVAADPGSFTAIALYVSLYTHENTEQRNFTAALHGKNSNTLTAGAKEQVAYKTLVKKRTIISPTHSGVTVLWHTWHRMYSVK